MSKEDNKKITTTVSKNCWKALKVLAVQKEVSLAEIAAEMLEKELYATESAKFDPESIIDKYPRESTNGEERGRMVYRMGSQPSFNQGCHNPYSQRREEKQDNGVLSEETGDEKRG